MRSFKITKQLHMHFLVEISLVIHPRSTLLTGERSSMSCRFIVAVHYTHMSCLVAIVVCPHIHHVVHCT